MSRLPHPTPSRRDALRGAVGLGIAVEFLGGRAWAASQGAQASKKLVVIICRGGMDGLSVSPPVGDANYHSLRGPIALAGFGQPGGALPLDDTFGLHPALAATHRLAQKGEARIAPAVATPDRARSHFEAQDVLESGGAVVYGTNSGWLNRALQAMGPAGKVQAISLGATAPLLLRGKVETAAWAPGGAPERDHRLPGILQDLYANDPLLSQALASGLSTEGMAKIAAQDANQALMAQGAMAPAPAAGPLPGQADAMAGAAADQPLAAARGRLNGQNADQARRLGATLAGLMTQPDGKQVAGVSFDGFDTHANQGAAQGQLANRLGYLDAFVDGLATGLGPAWKDTVVVVATEFGRTAHVNGTNGTDHGTASTALVLGGALKRGGLIGDWPTLQPARLFENRDTAPTLDMRGLFKGVLSEHLGVDRRALDTLVFPDSAALAPASGIAV
ncbi:DUF1501 domain-containing protein [Caulobacter sp. KR2-114]|uniref:DUF1501 domain-containing protein n=1 Tax=Caulobacter sp. KR2-114 TaxID=3400912 RepID=UPI003BFB0FD2